MWVFVTFIYAANRFTVVYSHRPTPTQDPFLYKEYVVCITSLPRIEFLSLLQFNYAGIRWG